MTKELNRNASSKGMYITLIAVSLGVTLMVSFSAYLVYLREQKQTEKELLLESDRNLQRLEQFINTEYKTVSEDLAFMSRNPDFGSYILNEPTLPKRAIEKTLTAYGEIRGSYTKIRLIDTTGVERLKIDFTKDGPKVNDDLQFKGDRYYFKGSSGLKSNEVYISFFDLNKEFGEFSRPFKPVLRFSTPFTDGNGKTLGYVVVTYDGKRILRFIKQLERRESIDMYILNSDGGYIKGLYPEWDWSFLFKDGENRNFGNSNAESWNKIESEKDGTLSHPELGLMAFRKYVPANVLSNKMQVVRDPNNYWFLLSAHNAEFVSDNLFSIRRDLILYTLLVLGTIIPIIAALFRNLIHKNDELNIVLVDLEQSNTELISSQSELQQNLTQMEELTQEKEEAIEELEIKERELILAKERAEEATKAKTNFLATMSHEIRTPMNAVIGMADLLGRSKLTEEQNELVKTIQLSGDALLTVINDILDFSRIQSGKMNIDNHPFNFEKVAVDALGIVENRAFDKKLELIYSLDPNLPEVGIGDEPRIRQVLLNLLSNAVKFTDEGHITVRILSKPEQIGLPGNVLIQVEDSGMGIPKEKQSMLFQPFNQLDSSITRKHGGSGLGLAISRTIIEQMGGAIQVESSSGMGSVFSFSIKVNFPNGRVARDKKLLEGQSIYFHDLHPLQRESLERLSIELGASLIKDVQSTAPKVVVGDYSKNLGGFPEFGQTKNILINVPKSLMQDGKEDKVIWVSSPVDHRLFLKAITGKAVAAAGASIEKKESQSVQQGGVSILLAEDNKVNQKLALMLLERMGFTTDLVENGVEALKAIETKRYHLILMDIQMPEMDGLEATKRIRKKYGRQQIIIALTANAMEGDRELYLQEGMDDYLSKPIRYEALQEKLNFWLKEIQSRM